MDRVAAAVVARRAPLAAGLRGVGLGLVAVVVGFPAAVLAVADRAPVALTVAGVVAAAALLGPARLRTALGVAAAMLAAGTAWGALAYDPVAQSRGGLVATVTDPAILASGSGPTFRAGQGRVLVDLRGLQLPGASSSPSTYRLTARADTDTVVVALPPAGCYRVVVNVAPLASRPSVYERAAPLAGLKVGPDGDRFAVPSRGGGQTELESMNEQRRFAQAGPAPLVAFGLPVRRTGEWTREAADGGAPTIEIEARAAAQVVVRDYPADLPIADADLDRVNLAWPTPTGVSVPQYPPVPDATSDEDDEVMAQRTIQGRIVFADGITAAARRSIDAARVREDRGAAKIAGRFAGPCASDADLARRWVSLSQNQRGTPLSPGDTQVDVNGLGQRTGRDRSSLRPVSIDLPPATAPTSGGTR